MRAPYRLFAISEAPTQYHVDIFRQLHRQSPGFRVLYGSAGQSTGTTHPTWGDSVLKNTTGLREGYESEILESRSKATLVRKIRELGIRRGDRVLFHTVLPPFTRHAAVACRTLGAQLLFRGSSSLPHYSTWRMNAVRQVRDAVFFRLFASFCATGTVSWEYFRRVAPDKTITFSPYCADEYVLNALKDDYTTIRREVREELSVRPAETLVVFMGRFIELKNIERLVAAYARVDGQPLRLVLAGDGPLREKILADIEKHEWVNKPRYLGYRDRHGVGRIFCGSDALALPSLQETWGVVVNEALHLGNSCMATTAVGCASDLILEGENGTIVDPLSIGSMADGLNRLIHIHRQGTFLRANSRLCEIFSAAHATEGILSAAELSAESYRSKPPGLDR